MKRVIISGGGTGGHIYPALAIAEKISELEETEFLYIGTKYGLEAELVPKAGYNFKTLSVQGLERKLSWQTLVTMKKGVASLGNAATILRDFKPHVVVGTGGYVCGPILLMAAMMKIPTLIQEQNVFPGITNKILSRFVDVVALGYEEAKPHFSTCENIVVTGNPVRPEVLLATREKGRKQFALGDEFTVLVAGGSRGARSINNAMIEVHEHFKERENIKIIHATGQGEYHRLCQVMGMEEGEDYSRCSRILPYLHDMPAALAAADLAVFRAGAVGLAELTVRGIPSILIPYPYASEDHQTYNARALVSRGAAKMIVDKMLTGKDLISEIEFFMKNRQELAAMAKACKSLGKPDAAMDIAKKAMTIAKPK